MIPQGGMFDIVVYEAALFARAFYVGESVAGFVGRGEIRERQDTESPLQATINVACSDATDPSDPTFGQVMCWVNADDTADMTKGGYYDVFVQDLSEVWYRVIGGRVTFRRQVTVLT